MSEFKYRPDVDGLRAVAVILVLLFHADFGFSGGFVGVDVFFVISGFLITGLLLKEQRSESFRLSHFWIRRIRRILPASTFIVMVTLVAAFFILLPSDYAQLAKSTIAQQLMMSNVYFYRNTGYFAGAAELKPLLHTWSLGVEEQFYLGYPFLLVLVSRFSRRIMVSSIMVICVVSFILSEWGVHNNPSAAFYLLPARAWELLLGGLLCFAPAPQKLGSRLSDGLSLLGFAGILIAAWCFDSTTNFPGASALLPCVGAAMVIYANTQRVTWIGRVLATKPMVYVGLISYSLYLWHWPILSLMRYLHCGAQPAVFSRVSALAASFVLAAFSLRYIESPFRSKRIFAETKSLLRATIGAASLVLACSLSIVVLRGMPQRFDPKAVGYSSAMDSNSFAHHVTAGQVRRRELPTFGAKDGVRKCLIWGDSHAMSLIAGIDAACSTHHVKGFQATYPATSPILDFFVVDSAGLGERSPEFNRAVVDFAIAEKVDVVIMAGVWHRFATQADFEHCLRHTIQQITAAGIPVAIVRDVARFKGVPSFEQEVDVPLLLSTASFRGKDVRKIGVPVGEYLKQNERCNAVFDQLAASNRALTILDPAPFFVDEAGLWRAEYGGESMYRDYHHLSNAGGLRLKPLFEKLFDTMGLK